MSTNQDYIEKLVSIKKTNEQKLLNLINKLEQCYNLEVKLNDKIKYSFLMNDKLNKIQTETENLFFDICKNINIKT